MSLTPLLLVLGVLALIAVIPVWPHSKSWGYAPSSTVTVIVVALLSLLLIGKL